MSLIRVADFVWNFLVSRGVSNVFLITGGNAMHLNDALRLQSSLKIVCMHHEQAAAIAAEGYARVAGAPGVLCTSSGPAAINALSGLYGAFVDSLPVICISGQSKRELLRTARDPGDGSNLRQLGVQEADAVAMAKPVTKYATTVMEPFQIRYELEKAWHLATCGRPGPVFLDIPLDVQAATINLETLPGFVPQVRKLRSLGPACEDLVKLFINAKRPVLVGGEGIREGAAVEEFRALAELLAIPVVTAWMPDLYPPDQAYYAGRLGTLGTRAGNFAVQNADLVLAVGSRLSVPQVSFNWETFVRQGLVVSVNVDPAELTKPISTVDRPICAEPKAFLATFTDCWRRLTPSRPEWSKWTSECLEKVSRYPEVSEGVKKPDTEGIHPYHFIDTLFRQLEDDAFVACGNAASACVAFQAAPLRIGQRLTSNASAGAMGHDLPSAIGSACARNGRRVICLAGDGSLMMNLQELQTLAHLGLKVGVIVMNNGGYLSIRTTQKGFFGHLVGEGPESGVSFPDYARLAEAFGISAYRINDNNFAAQLKGILAEDGPWLCEVRLNPSIGLEPRASSKILPDGRMTTAPIEDLYPFLDRQEFCNNMTIPIWSEVQ